MQISMLLPSSEVQINTTCNDVLTINIYYLHIIIITIILMKDKNVYKSLKKEAMAVSINFQVKVHKKRKKKIFFFCSNYSFIAFKIIASV